MIPAFRPLASAVLLLALAPALRADAPPAPPENVIGYHAVKLDAAGKLAPWYGSGPAEAYDHVLGLVWHFWITMRPGPTGAPYYLLHQVWAPQDDPRGLGGDQLNMALSSWNLLYDYNGDPAVRANMRLLADYWLDHGMAPAALRWGDLPYPYNLDQKSGRYDGDMRAGPGFLQPDKAATFGAELIMLYQATGERRYLAWAVRIADRLVQNVMPGDETHSPWPFRVHAATGEIPAERNDHDHLIYRAEYTTNWTGALRLFAGLEALDAGRPAAYHRTAQAVLAWLLRYPLVTNRWGPFFEDVSTKDYSDTEINADTFAAYLLEHPALDPQWRAHARGILDWTDRTFSNPKYAQWGVTVINEQTQFPVPGNSHTARHGAVELLYAEKTGDPSGREAAIRRLTWSTYWVDVDGKNRYPGDDIWLTDGYGDFVRHYLRAMASDPSLAPADQDHLLQTSSVVRAIDYGPKAIRYSLFDATSEQRFKLGHSTPTKIWGGTMAWDPATRLLRVQAQTKRVQILLVP